MALAIDGSSPVRFSRGAGGGSIGNYTAVSASFTAPAGSLLVVVAEFDQYYDAFGGGAGTNTTSISDSGGLTWTKRVERNFDAIATIWTAPVPTAAARTVSVSRNGSYDIPITAKVYVVTGQHASPIGASGSGSTTSNNSSPTIYTGGAAGSLAFVSMVDWSAPGAPSSSDLTEDAGHVAGQISYMSGYKTGASGSNTANLDAGGTSSAQITWVALEILAAAGGSDSLTATGIATTAPSVGSPSITQRHALTGTGIATTAPSTGAPAITQRHTLTGTGLATPAPSVGSPAIGQAHALTATGISAGAPTVGSPAIGQTHAMAASGIATGAPSAGSPALGQAHALAASGIATGAPSVGSPALSVNGTLAALPISTGAPSVGSPALGQAHVLAATGLTLSPTIQVPALGQRHALTASGVSTGAPTVGSPSAGGQHALTAQGLTVGAPAMGSPALGQRHALTPAGVSTLAPSVGSPGLVQRHALAAAGISTGAPAIDAPALGGVHALSAISIATGAPSVGSPSLNLELRTSSDRVALIGAVPRLVEIPAGPSRIVSVEAAGRSIRAPLNQA